MAMMNLWAVIAEDYVSGSECGWYIVQSWKREREREREQWNVLFKKRERRRVYFCRSFLEETQQVLLLLDIMRLCV